MYDVKSLLSHQCSITFYNQTNNGIDIIATGRSISKKHLKNENENFIYTALKMR